MSYDKERAALKNVFKNRKWLLKVNKMPDNQVIDIYKRLKAQQKV